LTSQVEEQLISTNHPPPHHHHSKGEPFFLFALSFHDHSYHMEVMFAQEEAEKFLGITAAEFVSSPDYAEVLDTLLHTTLHMNILFDLYVKVYTLKLTPKQPFPWDPPKKRTNAR
jgi:hypothetical protein